MRIIIFTVDHLYANLVVRELLKSFKGEIKLVVVSGVILHNLSLISSLKKYLLVSGLYYFMAQIIKLEIYKILTSIIKNEKSKFYSFKNLLGKKIPIKKTANVNGKKMIKVFADYQPDLIVSVFFNQLLSPGLIKLPKKGVINIHPAYLPDYKGVSPVFWALANNEKYIGASIHFIDEGIDTGGIIARTKISVNNEEGEDSLYLKSAKIGADLLIKAINGIKKGHVKTIKNSDGRYFSLPTKKAVLKFKKNGRNFFKLKEYLVNE